MPQRRPLKANVLCQKSSSLGGVIAPSWPPRGNHGQRGDGRPGVAPGLPKTPPMPPKASPRRPEGRPQRIVRRQHAAEGAARGPIGRQWLLLAPTRVSIWPPRPTEYVVLREETHDPDMSLFSPARPRNEAQSRQKTAPRPPKGSQRVPKGGLKGAPRSRTGRPKGGSPRTPQRQPKAPQRPSMTPRRPPSRPQKAPRSTLGRFLELFGRNFGSLWAPFRMEKRMQKETPKRR
jgi:hypothetical protein